MIYHLIVLYTHEEFKILNDEYGGKYNNEIVHASDVIRCKRDVILRHLANVCLRHREGFCESNKPTLPDAYVVMTQYRLTNTNNI
jgi:hypothetical protein